MRRGSGFSRINGARGERCGRALSRCGGPRPAGISNQPLRPARLPARHLSKRGAESGWIFHPGLAVVPSGAAPLSAVIGGAVGVGLGWGAVGISTDLFFERGAGGAGGGGGRGARGSAAALEDQRSFTSARGGFSTPSPPPPLRGGCAPRAAHPRAERSCGSARLGSSAVSSPPPGGWRPVPRRSASSGGRANQLWGGLSRWRVASAR